MNRPNHPNVHPAVIKQQYDTHNVWNFENHWRSKLMECKPCSRCCYSCFCCCCMGCSLAKHLGETTIIGCCPFSTCYLRTKLRTARRIEGSCCGDCCATNCCLPCACTQMANELESQGLWEVKDNRKTHPKPDRFDQNTRSGDY